jgi:hypothetical protein
MSFRREIKGRKRFPGAVAIDTGTLGRADIATTATDCFATANKFVRAALQTCKSEQDIIHT